MTKRTTRVALFVFNLSRFLSCLFLPPQMSPAICVGICRWKTRPCRRSRSTPTSSLPDFTWQSLIIWQPSFLFLPPRPGERDAATHCRSSITVQILFSKHFPFFASAHFINSEDATWRFILYNLGCEITNLRLFNCTYGCSWKTCFSWGSWFTLFALRQSKEERMRKWLGTVGEVG